MPQKTQVKGSKINTISSFIKRNAPWSLLAVISVFISGIVLVGQNPYPIMDDWSYCWSVQELVSSGKLKWLATYAPAIPLIISGAIASKFFGFSYLLMHNVCAAFSILAATGMFFAVKESTENSKFALISSATILFNPILVSLSFTGMTDPAGLAFMTCSVWTLARIVQKPNNSGWYILLLQLQIALGISTRQSVVVLLPGLALCGLALAKTSRLSMFLLLVGIAVQLILYKETADYLLANVTFPEDTLRTQYFINGAFHTWVEHPMESAKEAFFTNAKVMAYLGAFCFPALVWKIPMIIRQSYSEEPSSFLRLVAWTSLLLALVTVTLPLGCGFFIYDEWMPYFPMYWNFPEVGWYHGFTQTMVSPLLSQYWTLCCNFLGTLCSWAVTCSIVSGLYYAKRKKDTPLFLFLLFLISWFASQLFCGLIQGASYNRERYLLPLMVPTLLLFFCDQSGRKETSALAPNDRTSEIPMVRDISAKLAFSATLLLALYSFTAALDYTKFHSARWQAATLLESRGVPLDEIDVGPDYIFTKLPNTFAFCNPPTMMYSFERNPSTGAAPLGPRRYWPVLNETYVITPENFDPVLFRGYTPVFKQAYWSPWAWREKYIFVMKKR